MHQHLRRLRAIARCRGLRPMVAVAALGAGVAGLPMAAGAAPVAPAATGTVITTAATSYGRALVVGSGPFAGFSLYYLTSDHGTTFGCTTKTVTLPEGTIACTGPASDSNGEWPAITTKGRPIAAGGVSAGLLGAVERAGIGDQITYAGHPLYLFDQGPGLTTGENFDEPSVPPWHGLWYLVAPSGQALASRATLTTMRIDGKTVLATPRQTLAGVVDFPLYSYTRDTRNHSTCTAACARAWPPLLTSSKPRATKVLSAARAGTLSRASGTQARYDGKPLYLFGFEGVAKTPGGIGAAGTGNGISVDGGTFHFVTP